MVEEEEIEFCLALKSGAEGMENKDIITLIQCSILHTTI